MGLGEDLQSTTTDRREYEPRWWFSGRHQRPRLTSSSLHELALATLSGHENPTTGGRAKHKLEFRTDGTLSRLRRPSNQRNASVASLERLAQA